MPVRWSPLAVNDAMNQVDQEVSKIVMPLQRAREIALEAGKLPQLPEYLKWKISRLAESLEGAHSALDYRVRSIRDELPHDQLAAERQHRDTHPPLIE